MALWLRIHLPMQGTRDWSLVQEDPTCCRATKPTCHNYWAHVLQLLNLTPPEPMLRNKRKHRKWEACAPQWKSSPCSPQLEKAHVQQQRPNATKKKKKDLIARMLTSLKYQNSKTLETSKCLTIEKWPPKLWGIYTSFKMKLFRKKP